MDSICLGEHQHQIQQCALSNDESKLYSCDEEGVILVWDLKVLSKKPIKLNINGTFYPNQIMGNQRNTSLFMCSQENKIVIWNLPFINIEVTTHIYLYLNHMYNLFKQSFKNYFDATLRIYCENDIFFCTILKS